MKQFTHLFFLFIFSTNIHCQSVIKGIIKDTKTDKGLPFASIKTIDNFTHFTDVDGKFSINISDKNEQIIISYTGFNPKSVTIRQDKKYYKIYLNRNNENFDQISITNKNRSLDIIKKVIENKNENDPTIKLNSFQFKSYNKILISANPDSIRGKIDSIFITKNNKTVLKKLDSSDLKFKKIISKQHLFLTEKVSQYQYSENVLKENIIGIRMAGFHEPIYELLGFSLQSNSIYNSKYELFETKYNSPIDRKTYTQYQFHILDSSIIDNRKTTVIYFKNIKKKKEIGLEGLLFVDNENYAIAKAIMRVRGTLNITGIHEFKYFPKEGIWFPIHKNFKVTKGNPKQEISILGGRIIFNSEDGMKGKKYASDFTFFSSDSKFFDIEHNNPLDIKKTAIKIDVKDESISRPETFWKKYRLDSLDTRSDRTYFVLDSISNRQNIEKKINFGRKLVNGFLTFGSFDYDLRHLISFNNFEGFRLGFGGVTNNKFSKTLKFEGFTDYGLRDEAIKYNFGLSFRVDKFSNSWIGASYTDDIREIASTNFVVDKRAFKIYDPRPINISTFYNIKSFKAFADTRIIPKTESIWQITQSDITPLFNYTFKNKDNLYKQYSISRATVSIQWNPFSEYMQTPNGKIEIEKRFPKFTFQLSKTLPDYFKNDLNFGKIDLRVEYEKKYMNGQKTQMYLQSGFGFGEIPLTHMYNNLPNNLNNDNIIERISFDGKNNFETMYFNEFFSDKFIFLQLKHGSNRVEITKNIKPSLVFVSRFSYGEMKNTENHLGLNFKTLNKGFYESGIELNQIFYGLGLSGFYRYGPNQLSRFEDNLAIKITFNIDIGL